jgi:uncharacterized NAD(P)/FAD-binding protein YdhS
MRVDWLRARLLPAVSSAFFAPRETYGEYLGSIREHASGAGRNSLTHVRAELTAIHPDGGGAVLTLNDHSTTRAGCIVLAIGNPAYSVEICSRPPLSPEIRTQAEALARRLPA